MNCLSTYSQLREMLVGLVQGDIPDEARMVRRNIPVGECKALEGSECTNGSELYLPVNELITYTSTQGGNDVSVSVRVEVITHVFKMAGYARSIYRGTTEHGEVIKFDIDYDRVIVTVFGGEDAIVPEKLRIVFRGRAE